MPIGIDQICRNFIILRSMWNSKGYFRKDISAIEAPEKPQRGVTQLAADRP